MNVSSVSSGNGSCQSYQADFKQRFQDFKTLSDALQSGDLSSAQSAFDAFQKDLQNASPSGGNSQPFGQNAQAAQDFQALQDALKSGDVSAAQKAFASLKQDLKAGHTNRGHHRHHHHRVDNDGDADDSNSALTPSSSGGTNGTTALAATAGTLDVQA